MKSSIITAIFFSFFLLGGCSYLDITANLESENPHSFSEPTTDTKKGDAVYYYYFDKKIFLQERTDLLMVCFQDAASRRDFIASLNNVSSLKVWNPANSERLNEDDCFNTLVLQSVGEVFSTDQIAEIRDSPNVRYVSLMMGETDHLISVSDEFSVKVRGRSGYPGLVSLAKDYGCEVTHYGGFDDDIYFVRRQKESTLGTIQLSALFYETGQFEFTSPGFFCYNAMTSLDTFYCDQWNMNNTGQHNYSGIDIKIESAWNINEGSSDITVAVLDVGIELNHPDLAANLIAGYDAIDTTYVLGGAAREDDAIHGTAVAGIIGAVKDNGIGISGISPGCKIMPVRVGYYNAYEQTEKVYVPYVTRGFNWARSNGADVINCSFTFPSQCSLLTTAIHNATTIGRSGKGCVVVFSSGNEGNNTVSYPASLHNVIAVGATSINGKRKDYNTPDYENWSSNYGNTLDVVAPGVFIPTTDRTGYYGYNIQHHHYSSDYSDKNYTAWFNGTSSAAPQVAGIAALILSEYPDLPQDYVRRAIEMGCSKISGYNYSEDGNYPPATWNNEVGYGLVQADNALAYASGAVLQNTLDHTAGLDFTITNSSSYQIDNVIVDAFGTIGGQTVNLISCDLFEGIESGHQAGYPVYRGWSLSANAGTPITNITFELFASCIDCPGNLQVGIAFDTPTPNSYTYFSFGSGNTCQLSLPNITVPDGTRRKIYVRIFDV